MHQAPTPRIGTHDDDTRYATLGNRLVSALSGNDRVTGGTAADTPWGPRDEDPADAGMNRRIRRRAPGGNFEAGADCIQIDLADVEEAHDLRIENGRIALPDELGTSLMLNPDGERGVLSRNDFTFGPVDGDFTPGEPTRVQNGTSDDDRLRGTEEPDLIRAGDGDDQVETGMAGSDEGA